MSTADVPPRPRADDRVRPGVDRQPGGRRTIVIRGQVAPSNHQDLEYRSTAIRHRRRRPAERIAGTRPDRVAMYAVLMGVFLIAVAILTAPGA